MDPSARIPLQERIARAIEARKHQFADGHEAITIGGELALAATDAAFSESARIARETSGWVSVAERLPDGDDRVLVKSLYPPRRPSVTIGSRDANEADRFQWVDDHRQPLSFVTHWQPLPDAEGLP